MGEKMRIVAIKKNELKKNLFVMFEKNGWDYGLSILGLQIIKPVYEAEETKKLLSQVGIPESEIGNCEFAYVQRW